MADFKTKRCPTCNRLVIGPMLVCADDGALLVECPPRAVARKHCAQCQEFYSKEFETCPLDGSPLKFKFLMQGENFLQTFATRHGVSKLLATGTQSLIYEGCDWQTKEAVALKVLNVDAREPQYAKKLSRFSRPIETQNLSHKNLIRILDSDINLKGQFYLVYEMVPDGFSLGNLPGKLSLLPATYFVEIFKQICDGLEFAGRNGLIHQDLSSGDILISKGLNDSIEIKITDFAKGQPLIHSDNFDLQMTEVGDVFGHPDFMSPEVCRGNAVDESALVYSLGTVMYCALSENKPFKGANWAAIVINKLHHAPIPLVIGTEDNVQKSMRYIIDRCMQIDPNERFTCISDVKTSLLSLKRPEAVEPTFSVLREHLLSCLHYRDG